MARFFLDLKYLFLSNLYTAWKQLLNGGVISINNQGNGLDFL